MTELCDRPKSPITYRLARTIRADRVLRRIAGRPRVNAWISGYYRDRLYRQSDALREGRA